MSEDLEALKQRNLERLQRMVMRGQHFHPGTLQSVALELLVDHLVSLGVIDREAFERAYEERLSALLDQADQEHSQHLLLRDVPLKDIGFG